MYEYELTTQINETTTRNFISFQKQRNYQFGVSGYFIPRITHILPYLQNKTNKSYDGFTKISKSIFQSTPTAIVFDTTKSLPFLTSGYLISKKKNIWVVKNSALDEYYSEIHKISYMAAIHSFALK